MQQRSHNSSPPKARRILGKQSTCPQPASVNTPRPARPAVMQRKVAAEPPTLVPAHPARAAPPPRPARVAAARPARVQTVRPTSVAATRGTPTPTLTPAKRPTHMAMVMASNNVPQFDLDIDLPENGARRNVEFLLSIFPSVTVAVTLLILVSGIFYYMYASKISARASELRDIAIITAPAGSKTDIRSVVTRLIYDSQWKPEDVAAFLNTWQNTDATHKTLLTKKYWYKKFLLELRTDIKSVLERDDMTKQEREALIAMATNVGVLDSRYASFR